MLINLCETWAQLAPDEFEIHEQGGHGILLKADTGMRSGGSRADEIRIAMYKDRSRPFEMSALDQAKLERYLRRCAQARGWAWEVSTGFLPSNARYSASVTSGGPWENDKPFFAQYEESVAVALMQAYLPCLAAQRPISVGQWQHFKGDRMSVVGSFPFGARDIEDNDFTVEGRYCFEESPEEWADLLCWGDGYMEFQQLAQGHQPDRVAYEHDGKKWARKVSDFLALVGANHPEHKGKLRFVAIPND